LRNASRLGSLLVIVKRLHVGVEVRIFLLAESINLGELILVISNVDVLHLFLELFSLNPVKVLVNIVVFFADNLGVSVVGVDGVHNFDVFKAESPSPLLKELLVLFLTEEGRSHEFMSPEGYMVSLNSAMEVSLVGVGNHTLIVGGHSEGPNVVFLETVVNSEHVSVGRVSVQRLTLQIVEMELLIIIVHGDDGGGTNDVFFLCGERLHTLEVVSCEQVVIIVIVLEIAVVFDVLVETGEVGVEEGARDLTSDKAVETHLKTIVDLEVAVLVHVLMVPTGGVGATESLLLSVLVDAPEVVNTVVLGLAVVVMGVKGRHNTPEENVLRLQLKHG
jgi:hypothetical protein